LVKVARRDSGKSIKILASIREAQKRLLDTIAQRLLLPSALDGSGRYHLPTNDYSSIGNADVHPEVLSKRILLTHAQLVLFAAQVVNGGFRIRGIEGQSSRLLPQAQQLIAALEALRHVYRHQALSDFTLETSPAVECVTLDFIWALTTFQRHLNAQSTLVCLPQRFDQKSFMDQSAHLVQIMSKAVDCAIQSNLFTLMDMELFEPWLMLAIPRLAVLRDLLDRLDDAAIDPWQWFRPSYYVGPSFYAIRQRVLETFGSSINHRPSSFNNARLMALERRLVSRDSYESPHCDDSDLNLYVDICAFADASHSGPLSRQFVDLIHAVFKLHVVGTDENKSHSRPPQSIWRRCIQL
jgi:hypothetical protein